MRGLMIFLCLFGCAIWDVQAQEGKYVRGRDTLKYIYTPITEAEMLSQVTDTVRKKSILHRLMNYFEQANRDKTFTKKMDFSFIVAPGYSRATNWSIGGLAAGLYRVDRTDSVTPPSNLSIFGMVSISGFYTLGVMGTHIFRHSRNKIDYTLRFYSKPSDFWGTGYQAGASNASSSYVKKQYKVEIRYHHQVFKNTYIGGTIGFEHTKGIKFTYPPYLNGAKTHYTAANIGLIATYDTRDFAPNPYRGVYLCLQEQLYPQGLNNCGKTLWKSTFTANYYHQLWKGCIFAADLYGEFNTNGTPWCMMARLGDMNRMRGYYEGQYTDNNLITFQVELRQRIWRRIGCTAWGGAGNVFSSFAQYHWSQTLPNYGVGLRWEFKNRTNIRVDYGFGRHTNGLVFHINEAF
ncbi:MAG: BamA/TamA family outer membrane protein [Alistipes sp.]